MHTTFLQFGDLINVRETFEIVYVTSGWPVHLTVLDFQNSNLLGTHGLNIIKPHETSEVWTDMNLLINMEEYEYTETSVNIYHATLMTKDTNCNKLYY